MKHCKRLLSWLIVLAMLLSTLPTAAFAAEGAAPADEQTAAEPVPAEPSQDPVPPADDPAAPEETVPGADPAAPDRAAEDSADPDGDRSAYGLTICGTQVTDNNKADILGDGTFSYNSSTKTLTVNGSYANTTLYPTITNSTVPDLTVNIAQDATLSSRTFLFAFYANTVLTGSGILTMKAQDSTPIYVDSGKTLTIRNIAVFSPNGNNSTYGIRGTGSGGTKLILDCVNMIIIVNDGGKSFSGFDGGITLIDCEIIGNNYVSGGEITGDSPTNVWIQEVVYDLTIDGVKVTPSNKSDVLGNGVFSYDSDANVLSVKGSYTATTGVLIDNSIPGLTISCEVGSNHLGPEFYTSSTANNFTFVRSGADLTMTGNEGELYMQGPGNKYSTNGILMTDGAALTLQDLDFAILGVAYGIHGSGSGETLVLNNAFGYADTSPALMAVGTFSDITMTDCMISEPEGAFNRSGTICLSDNAADWAPYVMFGEVTYELYIEGTQVTNRNKNDVLGNGVFTYDRDSNTLYINKSYVTSYNQSAVIENHIEDLTIRANTSVTLNNNPSTYEFDPIISTYADLTVTGPGSINLRGNTGEQSYGIYAVGEGVDVTLKDVTMQMTYVGVGVQGALNSNQTLTLNNANLYVESNTAAISSVEGLTLTDCDFISPAYAELMNGTLVLDHPGSGETTVQTLRVANSAYDLIVNGVRVYPGNRTDVLGNGVFSYNPNTRTLSLSGSSCSQTSGNYLTYFREQPLVDNGIDGLTVLIPGDFTITTGLENYMNFTPLFRSDGDLTVKSNTTHPLPVLTLQNESVSFDCFHMLSGDLTIENLNVRTVDTHRPGRVFVGDGSASTLTLRNVKLYGRVSDDDQYTPFTTAVLSGFAGGVDLIGCAVITTGVTIENGAAMYQGAYAKFVAIDTEVYDLYIEGDRIHSGSLDGFWYDFDPVGNTLTISLPSSGTFVCSTLPLIENHIPGLTIYLADGTSFETTSTANTAFIKSYKDLTITGAPYGSAGVYRLALVGNGTAGSCGIQMLDGATLTLSSADVLVKDTSTGLLGVSQARLNLISSWLETQNTSSGGVRGFTGGLTLTDSRIILPENGVVSNGAICASGSTSPAADVKIYPSSAAVYYTVTFDVQGHGSAPAPQTVHEGYTVTQPADPAAEGWIFGGWYTDAACTSSYSFSSPVNSSLTLYAKWTQITYTVTFDVQGFGTAPAPQTVGHGNTASEPAAPAADPWNFVGWYADAACTSAYDFSAPVTGNLTIYAKWLYPLWVGAPQVTNLNMEDVLGDGAVSFDPSSGTLSFSVSQPNIPGEHSGAMIYAENVDLTINAPEGGLSFTDNTALYGVQIVSNSANSLTVNGDLAITAAYIPIYVNGGAVNVQGELSVSGGSYGVYAGSVSVSDDADAEAEALPFYANAGDISVGGTMTAVFTGTGSADCVYTYGNLTVSGDAILLNEHGGGAFVGGSVSVLGSLSVVCSGNYAVEAGGGILVNQNVTVTNLASNGYGLKSGQSILVGGSVVSSCPDSSLFTENGNITVVGSANLTGTRQNGDSPAYCVGYDADDNLFGDFSVAGDLTVTCNTVNAVSAGASITVNGDVNVQNSASNGYGLRASDGGITIGGDLIGVCGSTVLWAGGGSVNVIGDANVTSSTSGSNHPICCLGEGANLHVGGNLTVRCDCPVSVYVGSGSTNIDGNVDLVNSNASGFGLYSQTGDIVFGGTVDLTVGGQYGVYTRGSVSFTKNTVDGVRVLADITAGQAAIYAEGGLTIPYLFAIELPHSGRISMLTAGGNSYYTVTDANGSAAAAHVILSMPYLWVGGVAAFDWNKNDILEDGGKAVFAPDTGALTLNSPVYPGLYEWTEVYAQTVDYSALLFAPSAMDITVADLSGTVVLDADCSYLFYCLNGGITVNGDLVLENTLDDGCGIRTNNHPLTVNGSVTAHTSGVCVNSYDTVAITGDADLTSSGSGVSGNYAIIGYNGVEIGGNLRASATGTACVNIGTGDISVTGSAELTNNNYSGEGIHVGSGDVTIGGDLTAVTGSYCIFTNKNLSVEGNVDATSTGNNSSARAIYAMSGCLVGGNLKVTASNENCVYTSGAITVGGDAELHNTRGNGFYSNSGDITVSGSLFAETAQFGVFTNKSLSVAQNAELTTTAANSSKAAIYCNGSVTIGGTLKADSASTYTVYASGAVDVGDNAVLTNTYSSGYGVRTNGNVIFRGSLDLTSENIGVYTNGSLSVNGNVEMTTDGQYGVYSAQKLTVDGDFRLSNVGQYAVFSFSSVALNGNVEITGTGESGIRPGSGQTLSGGEGTWTINGTTYAVDCGGSLTLGVGSVRLVTDAQKAIHVSGTLTVSDGLWDLTGGAAAVYALGGLTLADAIAVFFPENGEVAQLSDGASGYYTVVPPADTAPAPHVIFHPAFWVGGVLVTWSNRNDILSDGGKAVYDPETRTLTLNSPTYPGFHAWTVDHGNQTLNFNALICSPGSINLTITDISGTVNFDTACSYVVYTGGGLTIDGNITARNTGYCLFAAYSKGFVEILGNADLTSTGDGYPLYCDSEGGIHVAGSLNANSSYYDCVYVYYGGLIVDNDLVLNNSMSEGEGVYAKKHIIVGGNLTSHTGRYGLYCYGTDSRIDIGGYADVTTTGNGYPLYCTGEGGIHVEGDLTAVSAYNECVYAYGGGLSVGGDLTMTNTHIEGYGVYTNQMVTVGGSVTSTTGSFGIYCAGSIDIAGDADLTSTASGYPIYCYDGTLTVGGDLTAIGHSYDAVYASGCVMTVGGDLTVSTDHTDGYGVATKTLFVAGDVTINSGSTGIYAYGGSVTLCGNVNITAAKEYGIYAYNGSVIFPTADEMRTWDVTGPKAAIFAWESIVIPDDAEITLPEGGMIAHVDFVPYYGDPVPVWTVTDADGAAAQHVIINLITDIPLWIRGVKVTRQNCGDILGNGKVSYNVKTKTLTVDMNLSASAASQVYSSSLIYAEGLDLTIVPTGGTLNLSTTKSGYTGIRNLDGTVTIQGDLVSSTSTAPGIMARGILITGSANLQTSGSASNGPLTATDRTPSGNITVGGDLTIRTGFSYGVHAQRGDVSVGGDVDIVITRSSGGIGINAHGNVTVTGNAAITTPGMAIYAYGGSVDIGGSAELASTGAGFGNYSVYAKDGIHVGGSLSVSGSTAANQSYSLIYTLNGDITVGRNLTAINDCATYGSAVRTPKGSVTVGGDAEVKGSKYAIFASNAVSVTGSLTAESTSASANDSAICASGADGVTVGRNLNVTASCGYGVQAPNGPITVGGETRVSGVTNYGLYARGGLTLTAGKADVDASNGNTAIYAAGGITIPSTSSVLLPEGGQIVQLGSYWTVTASDETTAAKHAVIWTPIDLRLGEIEVTYLNASDILGDGTASYDVNTGYLYFTVAEPNIPGFYSWEEQGSTTSCKIFSAKTLRISTPGELILSNSVQTGGSTYLMYVLGSTFVEGDLTLNNPTGFGYTGMNDFSVVGNVNANVANAALNTGGSIVINGNLNVTTYSESNDPFYAVAGNSIVIDGDLNIDTNCACGVYVDGNTLCVTGSATVNNDGGLAIDIANGNSGGGGIIVGSVRDTGSAKKAWNAGPDLLSVLRGTSKKAELPADPQGFWIGEDLNVSGMGDYVVRVNNVSVKVDGNVTVEAPNGAGISISSQGLSVGGNLTGSAKYAVVFAAWVSIEGDASVTCTSDEQIYAYAIYSSDSILIGGSVTVNSPHNFGLCANGSNNGAVIIFGDLTAETELAAIYARGSLDLIPITPAKGLRDTIVLSDMGIYVGGTTNVSVANDKAMDSVKGDIILKGDVNVTAGGTGSDAYGLWAEAGNIVVTGGTWDVTGGMAALVAGGGIEIPDTHFIRLPENGSITTVLTGTQTAWTVVNADSITAAHVLIREKTADGYYLIGKNGWTVDDVDTADKFEANPNAAGEYMLRTTLTQGSELKVVYVENNAITTWYPDGAPNYTVDANHAGFVTIYFRPNYDGSDDPNTGWYYRCLFVRPELTLDLLNTLALEGDTSLNYYVSKSALDAYLTKFNLKYTDARLIVERTIPGQDDPETTTLSIAGISGNYYVFIFPGIAAKELNNRMVAHVELTANNETYVSPDRDYNPISYCYQVGKGNNHVTLRKACADLIQYAAAAQTYFDYNTDNMPNTEAAGWDETMQGLVTQTDITTPNNSSKGTNGTVLNISTMTLGLDGRVGMNVKMAAPSGALPNKTGFKLHYVYEDYKGNTQQGDITSDRWSIQGSYYVAIFDKQSAGEMFKQVSFTIIRTVDGVDTVVSNEYVVSKADYAGNVFNYAGSNATAAAMAPLMHKMLNYGQSVYNYQRYKAGLDY